MKLVVHFTESGICKAYLKAYVKVYVKVCVKVKNCLCGHELQVLQVQDLREGKVIYLQVGVVQKRAAACWTCTALCVLLNLYCITCTA